MRDAVKRSVPGPLYFSTFPRHSARTFLLLQPCTRYRGVTSDSLTSTHTLPFAIFASSCLVLYLHILLSACYCLFLSRSSHLYSDMPVSHLGLIVSHIPSAMSFYLTALQPLGYHYIGRSGDSIGLGIDEPDFFLTQEPRGYS
jgi:hypothetical protein